TLGRIGTTLQQFGFVPFRIPAQRQTADVTVRVPLPYADTHYCLVAMTNQAGVSVSLKYTKRTSAVLTVFRHETEQEDSGVLQWIAVGEKGEPVHDEVSALHLHRHEENVLEDEWDESDDEADEDHSEEEGGNSTAKRLATQRIQTT
ncbi:WIAG-tail domain, partial [Brevibacillus agri]